MKLLSESHGLGLRKYSDTQIQDKAKTPEVYGVLYQGVRLVPCLGTHLSISGSVPPFDSHVVACRTE